MKLFAIGDLHLPGGQDKPMDVFGPAWRDHPERIKAAWKACVAPADWVLIPGDISWAMRLSEAAADIAYLAELPGHKVILRGNHDYWWHSIGLVRRCLPDGIYALQNDCVELPCGWAVCGSRGWELPGQTGFDAQDRKIYERELLRLELSLQAGRKIGAAHLVAMMHFPPAESDCRPTGFTQLLEEYGVELCVYGHLHDAMVKRALRGTHAGVCYQLVSADALDFTPCFLRDLHA